MSEIKYGHLLCTDCHRPMDLGDYGRIYSCLCGQTMPRFPKPMSLAERMEWWRSQPALRPTDNTL